MPPSSSSRFTPMLAVIPAMAFLLAFSGCSSTYTVKVDAIRNPDVTSGASYRIEPKDEYFAEHDPNYATATDLVRSALASKGMYEAENPRDAAVVITVDYGIGSHRATLEEAPAPTPVPSIETYRPSSIPGSLPMNGSGPEATLPSSPFATDSHTSNDFYRIVMVSEKFLELSARVANGPVAGSRVPAELWHVTTSVEDEATDVARALPILTGVAAEMIGTTTEKQEKIRVSEKDAVVLVAQDDR